MTNTCTNCSYYTAPTQEHNIFCAVNPGNNAENCLDYQPVVSDSIIGLAIAYRQQLNFELWAAQGAEFGIKVETPQFPTQWTMPEDLIQRLLKALPALMRHPKAINYSQTELAIALITWVEKEITMWTSSKQITDAIMNSDRYTNIWDCLPVKPNL